MADGARPVRCVLHGGDPDVQPTNASASGFRLAGDGRGTGEAPDVADDVAGELADLEAGDFREPRR